MLKHLNITRYHIVVVCLYIILVPTAVVFLIPEISFSFTTTKFTEAISICLVSLIGLGLYLYLNKSKLTNINFSRALLVVLYSLAFAVPEEILFRGFVQGELSSYFNSVTTLIISSLVFGFVHLFNGATGVAPNKWNWNLIVLAAIAGLPLGALFMITESLFFPVVLHTLFLVGLQLFIRDKNTLAKTAHIFKY